MFNNYKFEKIENHRSKSIEKKGDACRKSNYSQDIDLNCDQILRRRKVNLCCQFDQHSC